MTAAEDFCVGGGCAAEACIPTADPLGKAAVSGGVAPPGWTAAGVTPGAGVTGNVPAPRKFSLDFFFLSPRRGLSLGTKKVILPFLFGTDEFCSNRHVTKTKGWGGGGDSENRSEISGAITAAQAPASPQRQKEAIGQSGVVATQGSEMGP